MARDGSGTYSLPSGNPVSTGAVASSTGFNSTMTDLATALTASIAKDGQTVPSADLPMGGQKHTNVADAAARNQYAAAGQVADGDLVTIGSVSGTDTITGSLTPAITAYVAGMLLRFVPANTNTGAATINVNGVGAKAIVKLASTALVAGDLASGVPALILYDGTDFHLLNPQTEITAAAILAKLLTVDGASSTLDADLLDAQEGSFYRSASNLNAGTVPDARFPATLPAASAANLTSIPAGNLTGTIANARVAESNVTQHEAALAINASQVTSDFGNNNTSVAVASSMAGDVREVDSGSSVTLTVGNNCLGGAGKAALFMRRGSGTVTFAESSTTIRTKNGLTILTQHGAAALLQLSATEFQLLGDV